MRKRVQQLCVNAIVKAGVKFFERGLTKEIRRGITDLNATEPESVMRTQDPRPVTAG
jgi:hypothetical protein